MAELQRRFTVPLYSMSEAARYLGVPASTFRTWGRGYVRRRPAATDSVGAPVVTFVGDADGGAVVPFVGLAEGLVLAAFRRAGRCSGSGRRCSGSSRSWGSSMGWPPSGCTPTGQRCCTTSRDVITATPRTCWWPGSCHARPFRVNVTFTRNGWWTGEDLHAQAGCGAGQHRGDNQSLVHAARLDLRGTPESPRCLPMRLLTCQCMSSGRLSDQRSGTSGAALGAAFVCWRFLVAVFGFAVGALTCCTSVRRRAHERSC
jgi:hypothetical protein